MNVKCPTTPSIHPVARVHKAGTDYSGPELGWAVPFKVCLGAGCN